MNSTLYFIAQAIGIFGMLMSCISFQQKKARTVILFQMIGCVLFAVNFFMLGAYSGALLNLIGIIRGLVFFFKDKLHAEHYLWTVGFTLTYIGAYAAVFTVFGNEPTATRLIIELLPVIAMVASTLSYRAREASTIRKLGLVSSPLWLIYNIVCFSLGAILCESINLVSIITAMIRLDRRKKETEGE